MIPVFKRRVHRFGASPPLAVNEQIQFTVNGDQIVTIAVTGVSGAVLYVDPGDGSAYSTINLTGASTPWVHDYTGDPGVKNVTFYGSENLLNFNSTGFAIGIALESFRKFRNCTVLNTTGSTITGDAGLFNKINFPKVANLIIRQSGLAFEPWQFATLSGTLTVLYNYQNNGSGDLGGYAPLSKLTYLNVHTNPYTYLNTTSWPAYNGTNIQIHNCLSTAAEIDRFFIDGNTSLWSNCPIKADGTNPAPTAASAVAIAQLTARGCTVITN